jgi:hypothetical protein
MFLPFVILHYIPLQCASHTLHTEVGNGNHVVTFTCNRRFGMAGTGQRELEGNTMVLSLEGSQSPPFTGPLSVTSA